MIVSHRHGFVFVKTKKTAGTSVEIHLSQHVGPCDTVTPVQRDDERTRHDLGFPAAQNYGHSTLVLAPEDYEDAERFRTARDRTGVRFEKRFFAHMPAWEIRDTFGTGLWNRYYKFTIERNPWDKAVSAYFFHKARRGVTMSFDDYIARWQKLPVNYPLYTEPDDPGKVIVDHVYHYEDIPGMLRDLSARFGWPPAGQLITRSKSAFRPAHSDYRQFYSAGTRALVAEKFAAEIALFGYQF